MLIRSQDKELIVNTSTAKEIYVIGEEVRVAWGIDHCERLGKYSSKAKAIKVLDMIQAFYVVCESMKTVNGKPTKKLNKVMKAKIGSDTELFAFQMPSDEEVKGGCQGE